MEMSAKDGANVKKTFVAVAMTVMNCGVNLLRAPERFESNWEPTARRRFHGHRSAQFAGLAVFSSFQLSRVRHLLWLNSKGLG
jgi:hypothetical protein